MSESNVLAIDYGRKRFGFALGNRAQRTAIPLLSVERKNHRQILGVIRKLTEEFDVGRIVIGYPLNMDGTPSETCEEVDRFIRFLIKTIALPVDRIEERLTSFEAEEMLKPVTSDRRKRKRALDSVSALVILNNYWGIQ